jgi:type II secretion system protein N
MHPESANTLDTNLLASGKRKAPDEPSSPPSKRKKTLKTLAYVAIFLASLLFFFSLKTPKTMVQGMVLNTLNQQRNLVWQADSLEFRFFFKPHLKAQNFSVEPRIPGAFPSLTFDELRLFPSFLRLLTLNPAASFDGTLYGAEFDGSFAQSNTALTLDLTNADLKKIPALEGKNLQGILSSLQTDISLEGNRLSRLSGTIRGEGRSFVIDPAAFGVPIALPILDLGTLKLQATAQNGKVKIEGLQLGTPGKDLEVRITGDVTLNDVMQLSRIDLRLKLKPSEKILRAMPAIETTLKNMGALQPDGFYAMKMVGQMNGVILPTPDR